MTGRRPDATKCWSFLDHFREEGVGDSWVSMPEWFRVNGYGTTGCGKLCVAPRLLCITCRKVGSKLL